MRIGLSVVARPAWSLRYPAYSRPSDLVTTRCRFSRFLNAYRCRGEVIRNCVHLDLGRLWLVDVNWTLLLPREAESVGKARRMLRDTATLAGVDPEVSFDLGVALTEACANVIEHAGQAEGYWVAAGISSDRCWIDVIDNGVGFAPRRLTEHAAGTSRWQRARIAPVPAQEAPAPQPAVSQTAVSQAAVSQAAVSQMSESGRGLMLIEALCDRVDIRNHPARGAMIHFERDLKPQ